MSYTEPLAHHRVGISISNAEDTSSLGLGLEHLHDAMCEIARHLVALGARLVYAGDLREGGFTELLLELVARHRRDSRDTRLPVSSYLPWPVHMAWSPKQIAQAFRSTETVAELQLLDVLGQTLPRAAREKLPARKPAARDWVRGLTAARERLARETDARIVLGGRLHGFMGRMPGIAEEALITLRARQPLYVVGGFGGSARAVARALGLTSARTSPAGGSLTRRFSGLDARHLANGLTRLENQTLAETAHIDQAIALILRGLAKTRPRSGRRRAGARR